MPVRESIPSVEEPRPLEVAAIYSTHVEFVWRTLFRLGVRESDLEDMVQEVFMVVHRRLNSYDGTSKVTTWLFGIAMRVASTYRRAAHRRRERPFEPFSAPLDGVTDQSPEQAAVQGEARARLEAILDTMDDEKRAAFVLFEIEKMPCSEIAALMDVPVGTVYSRLHAARRIFEDAIARDAASAARRGAP